MVSDGLEALVALGRNPPDVLIADLALPRVDGFEMLRMLRKDRAFSDMDIIVVSALSRDSINKKGGVPAGITVLAKPVPYEQLLGFLQACIARRKIHPTLAQ
jgi:DNA-binding response OmpR family regulator